MNTEKKDNCPNSEDLTAWKLGELSSNNAIKNHILLCDKCKKYVDENFVFLKALNASDQTRLKIDLRESVKMKIRKHKRNKRMIRFVASILIVFGLFIFTKETFVENRSKNLEKIAIKSIGENISPSLVWLRDNQESWGGWAPEKWGGKKEYSIGLSAFSMIPFVHEKSSENMNVINETLAYLISKQNKVGCFGEEFNGSLYNQALTTLALLQLYQTGEYPEVSEHIIKSLNYILRRQSLDGGWGYASGLDSNIALTSWQISTMILASKVGLLDNKTAIVKSLGWVENYISKKYKKGFSPSYQTVEKKSTSTAMAIFCLIEGENGGFSVNESVLRKLKKSFLNDLKNKNNQMQGFYQSFFTAMVIRSWKTKSPEINEYLKKHKRKLLKNRENNQGLEGTWASSEIWGKVGGRIFCTSFALTTLALENNKYFL